MFATATSTPQFAALQCRAAPPSQRAVASRPPRCPSTKGESHDAVALPVTPSRRALLAAATTLPAAALIACSPLSAPPARAAAAGREALAALLVAKLAAAPLDYRACVRLLFNDAASGGRDGSVHLPEELARPENADLKDVVAVLTQARTLQSLRKRVAWCSVGVDADSASSKA